jgi:membrane protein YqaA with SNARE-associated domain
MPHCLANTVSVGPRHLTAWLVHLGGIGLVPLGLLDNSIIPVPGSMDFAVILLTARDKQLWFYYAAMATAGSVLGAFLTYRIARKGGKEALAKRLSKSRADKALRAFERWGFAAITIPALLPPPFPFVPFVVAAGAMQYSLTRFLTALAVGRAVRYSLLAWLGVTYGRHIVSVLSHHAYLALGLGVGLSFAIVIIGLMLRRRG